jgi:putative transposase
LGHDEYSAAKWARFLHVSLSGYNAWKQIQSLRESQAAGLDERICIIFHDSKGKYGAGRICGVIRRGGCKASFRKVRDRMGRLGLHSVHERRRARSITNSSKPRGDGFPNLTKGMNIEAPFQVLSSDISYIRTYEGFDYLCQIKDVASGVIVAWSMGERMKSGLVTGTAGKAMRNWDIPEGCIFHSDRGSQYTSGAVKRLLEKKGLRQSFSRVGKPGDNAWSESFFANLKKEAVHWVHFATRAEARQAMFEYIDGFYNAPNVYKKDLVI